MTLRLVLGVVVATIISMALPNAVDLDVRLQWSSRHQGNRVITTLTGIGRVPGATIGIAMSLFFYRYTFDYPELVFQSWPLRFFAGMFFSRIFAIGPLAFAIRFRVGGDAEHGGIRRSTDELVRGLLWLWVITVFPSRSRSSSIRRCRQPIRNRTASAEPKEKFVLSGRFHKSHTSDSG